MANIPFWIVPCLILWPVAAAAVMPFLRDRRVRSAAVYLAAGGVMALAAALLGLWLGAGAPVMTLYAGTEAVDHLMTAGELFLMALIVVLCIRHRQYPVILLSVGQTGLLLWSETNHPVPAAFHMQIDCLTMLMCKIAAFVGGFICIYAVGYMKAYHEHHTEYADRSGFFFSMLFLFLGAMFGLVLCENLVWMYFF